MVKFPRYKPIEAKIAERFLALRVLPCPIEFSVQLHPPKEYLDRLVDELKKSLQVQLGITAPIILTPEEENLIVARHSWYIDAVAHCDDADWLIEIKPELRKSLIGQLIAYRDYYIQEYKPAKPVKLAAVVAVDNSMVRPIAEKYGITVWVIPP